MTGVDAARRVIALHGNKPFGVTGPDAGQCTAVPHSLMAEVLRIPIVYGHAKDIYGNALDRDWVKIGPRGHFLPGDIASQGGNPVLGTDPRWGHTFMLTQESLPGQPMTGYSQNYPTYREPHVRTFPRNGLIGVIRARVLQSGGGTNALPYSDAQYNAVKAEAIAGWAEHYVGRRPGITEIRKYHLRNDLARDRAGWAQSEERRRKIKKAVTEILRVVAGSGYVYPDSEVDKHMAAGTPWSNVIIGAYQNAVRHLAKKQPSDSDEKLSKLREAVSEIQARAAQAATI